MNFYDPLPRLVKEKLDLEAEVYGFPGYLKHKHEGREGLRAAIDRLTERHVAVRAALGRLREQLEDVANGHSAEPGRVVQTRKVLGDVRVLETLAQKGFSSTLEKLKLAASAQGLTAGPSIIQMDEGMQQKYLELANQEELVDDANAKGNKALAIGANILENLHGQSLRSKSILGSLGGIGRELRLSSWTSGAINRRLQADKRLVWALFLAALAVVVLAKFVIKRVLK